MSKRFFSFVQLAEAYANRGWNIDDTPEAIESLIKNQKDNLGDALLLKLVSVLEEFSAAVAQQYIRRRCAALDELGLFEFKTKLKELEDEYGPCPKELADYLKRHSIQRISPWHLQNPEWDLHVWINPPPKGEHSRKLWDAWKKRGRKKRAATS